MTATIFLVLIATLAGTGTAFAIPSPELVVGSLSSISQLVALVSAILGGGAAVGVARAGSKSTLGRAGRYVVGGLVLVAAGSLALNLYQYFESAKARQDRLESTLIRPAPRDASGKTLDPALKEASWQDQLDSPQGVSTEEAETLLLDRGKHPEAMFLDIREKAETEMGSLPDAKAIRFPDLATANMSFAGKKPILFCHNGNRSYETCQRLHERGIDCRFIVGGLEKWLVERRSLTGLKARTLDDLRAVPPYHNQGVLLDTSDVHKLVDEQGAIFVDVRYPGEFAAGHLPNAVNIPIRPTPTVELKEKIAALPDKPVITPCYDRRSCFFGEIIGLELDRGGRDFRGRYTQPWDFFTPTKPRPYIAEWLALNNQTYWSKGVGYVAAALSSVGEKTGLVAAILLLALLSRILVAPFSLKAERDQLRSRAIAPEVDALKERLKDDSRRLSRAMRAVYRRNELTPLRNLIALLFLPLMAMSVSAAQSAATFQDTSFLWLPSIAERDTTFILPILFSGLICLYLQVALAHKGMHTILTWALGFPLLIGTGALLSAASDLYLVASAALLLAQRAIASGALAGAWKKLAKLSEDADIPSLDQPEKLSTNGNKAFRLAQMKANGFPVPDGVVLTPRFLERLDQMSADGRKRAFDRLWRRLGAPKVVVRSSAACEDGDAQSFAGVFESILHVDRASLEDSVEKVRSSFSSERAQTYSVEAGQGSIVVQSMVDAQYAGVLFTRHPTATGQMLIELVEGTAEGLVSGSAAPENFSFGRLSGRPIGAFETPIDLLPLMELGRKAEQLFGKPQDVEWTYEHGRFLLVQSRDITRLQTDDPDAWFERERGRILDLAKGADADEIVFEQSELAEMLPRPTPLSLALMESLLDSGGSIDLAARSLGLTYGADEDAPNELVTAFGRLYVDMRQKHARASKMSPLAARRLAKSAERIEHDFRDRFLPEFLDRIRVAEAVDFDRLSLSDLKAFVARTRKILVTGTHVEVDRINIAADFLLNRARKQLTEKGFEPASYLAHIPETEPARAIAEAAGANEENRAAILLGTMRHRALFDYELADPRYGEAPDALGALCAVAEAGLTPASSNCGELERLAKDLAKAVEDARRFQSLKEDAKHHSLREVALLRHAVFALGRRFDLGEFVFFLDFEELADLNDISARHLRSTARRRCRDHEKMREIPPLPLTLTIAHLETLKPGGEEDAMPADGVIHGTRVSGSGVVEGRARVVSTADAERGAEILDFEYGDIIVATMIHPAWLSHFRHAGGLVCEIGGWLSHTAIVAREYDLPMIVGAHGSSAIAEGSGLRLHVDGRVELVIAEGNDALRAAAE